jgi:flagellar hook-basal body complex protein FliE
MNTATGENVDLHSQMIALEEANISIRAMGSARDKIVEAYQSIWNMQI